VLCIHRVTAAQRSAQGKFLESIKLTQLLLKLVGRNPGLEGETVETGEPAKLLI
jgi:hypothetical protein